MKSTSAFLTLLLLITGCAQVPQQSATQRAETVADIRIAPFSENALGGLPNRWEPMVIHRNKKNTQYTLVADQGKHVLHARAVSASSGLMQKVNIDPLQRSQISWRWRISGLIESADNHDRALEDAPARIVLAFDGNKELLPFTDQIMFETARIVTGREFPYAMLMYIWGRRAPVDTLIPNAHSKRIKMIVASSGEEGVGEWKTFSRNIAADYERAFGEKPGKLISVGVLTDTDNTGETVDAWYGDIRLKP